MNSNTTNILDKDIMSIRPVVRYILYALVFLFPIAAGGNGWFGFDSSTGVYIVEIIAAISGLLVLGFYEDLMHVAAELKFFQWWVFVSAIVYVLITVIAAFYSIDMFKSESIALMQVSGLILLIAVYAVFDKEDAGRIMLALILGGAVVAGMGIFQAGWWFSYLSGMPSNAISPAAMTMIEHTFRAFGTFEHPNVMAGFLLMVIPSAYMLALERKGTSMYLYAALPFIVTLGLFVTYSRAAIFLYALSLIFIYLVLRKRVPRFNIVLHIVTINILALILSFIIISTYNGYNRHDLANKYAPSKLAVTHDSSFMARERYAGAALGVIEHNPWLGTGPGTYGIAVRKYQVGAFYARHAHDNYLELTSEIGVFGLLSFLLFVAGIFVLLAKGLKRGSLLAGTMLISMGCFVIHTGMDFDYASPAVVLVLFVFGAVAMLYGKETHPGLRLRRAVDHEINASPPWSSRCATVRTNYLGEQECAGGFGKRCTPRGGWTHVPA